MPKLKIRCKSKCDILSCIDCVLVKGGGGVYAAEASLAPSMIGVISYNANRSLMAALVGCGAFDLIMCPDTLIAIHRNMVLE